MNEPQLTEQLGPRRLLLHRGGAILLVGSGLTGLGGGRIKHRIYEVISKLTYRKVAFNFLYFC